MQLCIHVLQVVRETSLVLVEQEPTLRSKSWREEERKSPGRYIAVGKGKNGYNGAIKRDRRGDDGEEITRGLCPASEPTEFERD